MARPALARTLTGSPSWAPAPSLPGGCVLCRVVGWLQSVCSHASTAVHGLSLLTPILHRSLTLGATRVFRLHRKLRLDLFAGAAGASSTLHTAAAAGGSITRIDVPLPHNTLVIMWPPCQEAWKHEVRGLWVL